MDVLTLSRLQFALTCAFHFIFVPLTLGLSVLVAAMEVRYARTGNTLYLRMTKFWGKLFLINFALGVVTGITMEFQFGMNWAEYSRYVGDIFGAPLAIEATAAFFLESVFIGIWIFGWNKLSRKAHAISICIVAFATNLSGLWILIANGWMQHPVGYVIRNGRAEMTDFLAVVLNHAGLLKFLHQISSAYVVAAFFVMGVSAWHLLRKRETEFFKQSIGMAALFGFLSALVSGISGDMHAVATVKNQPAKLAAMESLWETTRGADINILQWPDEANERNSIQALPIPHLLSILATHRVDGEVKGLKDIPKDERPPVWPVFLSFRAMAGLGMLFLLLSFLATLASRKDWLEKYPLFLNILVLSIPLPYLANQFGWIVAEMGRQPWIVYGIMKTSDGVSRALSTGQVAASLVGFVLLYGLLGAVDIYLLTKYAKKGPDADVSTLINMKRKV